MYGADAFDTNNRAFIISAIILGTVGVLSFIVQPGLVQGFVSQLGYSEAEANGLAFWEMSGVAAATILIAIVIARIPLRRTIAAALGLAAGGNILSALVGGGSGGSYIGGGIINDYTLLATMRLVTGLGEGVLISTSFSMIGMTVKIQRNLAWYLLLLLMYGALGLWSLPVAFVAIGLRGIFGIWAGVTLLSLVTLRYLPKKIYKPPQPVGHLPLLWLCIALGAVLLYNSGIGLAWANLFLIGLALGGSEQTVANALLLSQFTAIGGALLALFIGAAVRPAYVIIIGIVGGALSIAVLLPEPNFIVFIGAVSAFNFLWNMTLPFILATIEGMERSGRMIAAAIAMQMVGLGFGPLIAVGILGTGGSLHAVEMTSSLLLAASLIFLLIAMSRHRSVDILAAQGGVTDTKTDTKTVG